MSGDPNNSVDIITDTDVTVIQTSFTVGPQGPPGPTGPQGPAGLPGAGSPAVDYPLMDGAAAIGTSLLFAREDHIHPSDTSRLGLAGGTMAGPLILAADPTAALGAATKQYADQLRANSVLLNTLTASNSAALLDTTSLLAPFTEFELRFQNIIPVVTERILQLQVRSGGSLKTAGYNCCWGAFGGNTWASTGYTAGLALSFPSVGYAGALGNFSPGFCGSLRITNPANSGMVLMNGNGAHSSGNNTGYFACIFSGIWGTSGIVDGFQISMDSGNIASGSVKVYGIR